MRNGVAKIQIREKGKRKTVALAEFMNDGTKILVSDYDVYEEYQRQGYGTILAYTLMGISRTEGIPIVLFAIDNSLEFYEKMGFISLRKFKRGKYRGVTLTIANLNEVVDFERQVGSDDMIWIPPNLTDIIISL